MEKKSIQNSNIFVSEEEKTLNWSEVQSSFEKSFGKEKDMYKKNRAYWAKQCCYKFDGKISFRILKMIEKFIRSKKLN